MSSRSKIGKLKSILTTTANIGGSCGCRRPKATDVIEPKSDPNLRHCGGRKSTADDEDSKIQDSLAVVKDSDDPYEDFRQSMVQMILEKEIYSPVDLLELLHCFLHLNSPHYHHLIVRAFMEISIWNTGEDAPPCSSANSRNRVARGGGGGRPCEGIN